MDLNDLPRSRLKPFSRFDKAVLCVLLTMLLLYTGALLSKNYLPVPECRVALSQQANSLNKEIDTSVSHWTFCHEQKVVKE